MVLIILLYSIIAFIIKIRISLNNDGVFDTFVKLLFFKFSPICARMRELENEQRL